MNNEKIDVIAKRTREPYNAIGMILPIVFCVVLLPVSVYLLAEGMWFYDSWDPVTETEIYKIDRFILVFGIIFALVSIASLVWFIYALREIRQNNKSRNPTIGITENGVFVIYHANGKKEYLRDKILQVSAKRHTESYQNRTGNWVTTTTNIFSHGWVKFMLEKQTGEVYYKKVKHVSDCIETANRIESIISVDKEPNITRYENKKMFCQYCGGKINADGKCSNCGGNPAIR